MADNRASAEISRKKIGELLDKQERPDNVLLVGATGVGKSSLVNTLSQAITSVWSPQAITGRGSANPVTDDVTWYPNCNVQNKINSFPRESLPNIIDMPGHHGHDQDKWKKIVVGIVEGRIRDGSSVTFLLEELEKHPRHIDSMDVDKTKEISKIVIVSSVREDTSKGYVDLILEVAVPRDGTPRSIPVYGVVTHGDLIESKVVNETDGKKRKKDFVDAIQKQGAEGDFVSDITNYCDTIHPRNDKVEAQALDFLRKILVQKTKHQSRPNPNKLTLRESLKRRWLETPHKHLYILAFIVLVLSVLLYPYMHHYVSDMEKLKNLLRFFNKNPVPEEELKSQTSGKSAPSNPK